MAAQEHLTVARELHESERYVLAHYVAGLAAECMLRAFKSRLDPTMDERHDLQLLARNGRFWEGAGPKRLPMLAAALGEIVTRWDNGHRYRSEAALRRFLSERRLFRGKGDVLKNSSRRLVDAATQVVTFGVQRWKS